MPGKKNRIIIDTNIWISFLLSNEYSKLDSLINDKRMVLVFSEALLEEFIQVAQRPKFKNYFSTKDLEILLLQIKNEGEFIIVKSDINICRDPKDNFYYHLPRTVKPHT